VKINKVALIKAHLITTLILIVKVWKYENLSALVAVRDIIHGNPLKEI